MRKTIKNLLVICITLCMLLTMGGCALFQQKKPSKNLYDHYNFSTQYTVEGHTQRLGQRTAEKFEKELKEDTIVDFAVEIVYSFYDHVPEFFVVTLEYAEMQTGTAYGSDEDSISYETKYKHVLGYIDKDVYKIGISGYSDFIDGRDPWTFNGYGADKKYYGFGSCGVVVNGKMTEIFNIQAFYSPYEFGGQSPTWSSWNTGRHIDEEQEKWLAECIPAWDGKVY